MLLTRKLKRQYKQYEGNILDYLRKYNPKQFYSMFRRQYKNTKPLHTLDQLYVHFKYINIKDDSNNDTANTDNNIDPTTDGEYFIFDELDTIITQQDILDAINNLKRVKPMVLTEY